MEIKNILSKINQTSEEPENFFAIEIGHEVVKTAIWHVKDKVTQIVSVGSIEEWNKSSEESLIEAIDASLSVASEGQSEDINKVIFGLPETWVGLDGIVESKKLFLKTITKKLDIKPVGFVVSTEAIIHHLRIKEGGPPSVILISLTEAEATISMVIVGEIIGTQAVGRSDDLSKDVEEGLARFSQVKDLPTRMIVYDGNIDLDAAKQTLISYDWKSAASFLHFPKIEDLSPQSTIKAIAIAGGTEVAKSLGIQVEEPEEEETTKDIKPIPELKVEEVSAKDFGFDDPTTKDDHIDPLKQEVDIGDNFQKVHSDEVFESDQAVEETTIEFPPETKIADPVSLVKKKKFSFKLPKFKKFKLLNTSKKFPVPPIIVIGGLSLILLFSAGAYAYWNYPKAEITIHIKPKTIEKEINFTLDTTIDILDYDESIIPAKEESIELEGEKETNTTGTKLVGEKAAGTVSVFNLTEYEKTFEAGTSINFDNLEFTLNEDVIIASATAELGTDYKKIVTPSQETVKVTAVDIGDQYNFSTGTELYVENFDKSSFVAKATTDFSGGFAREIQAVSKEDQDNLKAALLKDLKQQGISNLSVEASQEKRVVELNDEEIVKETFSADIGDEEESLRLALQFKLPIYTYHLGDLSMLVEKKYSQDFPDNFSIDPKNLTLDILESELTKTGVVEVSAKANLNLSPDLNLDEIAQKIRGRYPEDTISYFSGLPNFSRTETTFNISLPTKLKTFPRKLENISIIVETEN